MEFDQNGNGDIGEKGWSGGVCRPRGGPSSRAPLDGDEMVWERAQLPGLEEGTGNVAAQEREREPLFSPPSFISRYHVSEANVGETWGTQDPPGAKEINQGGFQWLWGDFQLLRLSQDDVGQEICHPKNVRELLWGEPEPGWPTGPVPTPRPDRFPPPCSRAQAHLTQHSASTSSIL